MINDITDPLLDLAFLAQKDSKAAAAVSRIVWELRNEVHEAKLRIGMASFPPPPRVHHIIGKRCTRKCSICDSIDMISKQPANIKRWILVLNPQRKVVECTTITGGTVLDVVAMWGRKSILRGFIYYTPGGPPDLGFYEDRRGNTTILSQEEVRRGKTI